MSELAKVFGALPVWFQIVAFGIAMAVLIALMVTGRMKLGFVAAETGEQTKIMTSMAQELGGQTVTLKNIQRSVDDHTSRLDDHTRRIWSLEQEREDARPARRRATPRDGG